MGYQVSDQDQSGTHSNNTAYVGQGVFGPLLRQLANQYGTQQAAADLIFGGKQYGKARTYLPDQYRDMTPAQGQSLNNARAIEQQNREMPSYKGADGTIWTWDKKGQVYIGYQKDKGEYTKKVGAWSPWDKENTTPPWKQAGAPPDPPPPADGGGPPIGGGGTGSTGGTGGTGSAGGTGGGTSGGSGGGEQGGQGGSSGHPGGGGGGGGLNPVPSTNPSVPLISLQKERLSGMGQSVSGVRTESPQTEVVIPAERGKGPPATESETQEFGRRFGITPTGMTATYNPQSENPFDAGDPSNRNNWNTSYDPRPSNRTLRPPEEDASEQTFAKLLAGLRR